MKSEKEIAREVIREQIGKVIDNLFKDKSFLKNTFGSFTAGEDRKKLQRSRQEYNKKFVIPEKPEYKELRSRVLKIYFNNSNEYGTTFFTDDIFQKILNRISVSDIKTKELIENDPELIDALKDDLMELLN